MKKTSYILLIVLLAILNWQCEDESFKDDEVIEESLTIGDEKVESYNTSVETDGKKLKVTTTANNSTIEAVLSSNIEGTYTIVSPDAMSSATQLKAENTLEASVSYTNSTSEYTGTGGTIEVKMKDGKFTFAYDATLTSSANENIEIVGSFANVTPEEVAVVGDQILINDTQITPLQVTATKGGEGASIYIKDNTHSILIELNKLNEGQDEKYTLVENFDALDTLGYKAIVAYYYANKDTSEIEFTSITGGQLNIKEANNTISLSFDLIVKQFEREETRQLTGAWSGIAKSVEITVKDASSWTPENTSLSIIEDVLLMFFQEDSNQGDPIAEVTTNAEGEAVIYGLNSDSYQVSIKNYNDTTLKVMPYGYVINGVFNTQEEIDNSQLTYLSSIKHELSIGGYQFCDMNGDAIINENDKMPYSFINGFNSYEAVQKIIYLGKERSGNSDSNTSIKDSLHTCYNNFINLAQYAYIFDATYTNNLIPDGNWLNIRDKQISTSTAQVTKLWNNSYALIFSCNRLLQYTLNNSSLATQDAELVKNQALMIRAYTYHLLTNWFGDVPIQNSTTVEQKSRNPIAEVHQSISNDIENSIMYLPNQVNIDEQAYFSSSNARLLLARIKMRNAEWEGAIQTLENVINSGQYNIEPYNTRYSSLNNIPMGFQSSVLESDSLRKGDYVSLLGYNEAYINMAYCKVQTGDINAALEFINALRQSEGLTSLSANMTQEELLLSIYNTYFHNKMGIIREGLMFEVNKRFQRAQSELNIQDYQLVLPIPSAAFSINLSLSQNPGY